MYVYRWIPRCWHHQRRRSPWWGCGIGNPLTTMRTTLAWMRSLSARQLTALSLSLIANATQKEGKFLSIPLCGGYTNNYTDTLTWYLFFVYRYDYLEFTDAGGAKHKFDGEVGSERWPKRVEFKGQRLHLYFYSDSSNNEWGYKFTVSWRRLTITMETYQSTEVNRSWYSSLTAESLRTHSSTAWLVVWPPGDLVSSIGSAM